MQSTGPGAYFPPAAEDGFGGGDGVNVHERIFSYCAKAYTAYMQGAQDFSHLDDDLAYFIDRNADLHDRDAAAQAEIEQLMQIIHDHKTQPARLQQLAQRKEEYLADQRKFVRFIDECTQRVESRRRKQAEKRQVLEEARSELARLRGEVGRLRGVLERQELSQVDVKRITMERQSLVDQLQDVKALRDDQDKIILDRELDISKRVEQLERTVHQYHVVCERLHLVPQTARNANGLDLELRLNANDPHPEQMLAVHIKGSIKPGLHQLKEWCGERRREHGHALVELHERMDQLHEEAAEYRARLDALEARIARIDAQYKDKKDVCRQGRNTVCM